MWAAEVNEWLMKVENPKGQREILNYDWSQERRLHWEPHVALCAECIGMIRKDMLTSKVNTIYRHSEFSLSMQ